MILKLIKTIVGSSEPGSKDNVEKAAAAKRGKDNALMDVAHEAMRFDAARLGGILNAKTASIDKKRKKEKVKSKIKDNIDMLFDNDDIIEEVTEKIMDAAEFDPMYDKMFGNEK